MWDIPNIVTRRSGGVAVKDDRQLAGSFLLVMVLGALMTVGWVSIFELYLSRQ
jgi:hypothetical protein